ncbi:uncharacterized protein LOC107862436 [Capsicum annuum]|uniref:uncharacterized protein LOC107862436 n=1 Tax=Capsicum annuum TaxID=4072 RepID=UPI0007BF085C|nr:uncharacterized protein LOC107862436 [Capsicum annuum]
MVIPSNNGANAEESTSSANGVTGAQNCFGIDNNHPLFLNPSDISGLQIISFQLTGIENFSMWFTSMRLSFLGRNKLGMVDGSCFKDKSPPEMGNHWERVNAIVLSWIMSVVAKRLLGGIMYATSAQVVWSDLCKRFNKVDGSRTFNLHKEIATLTQVTPSVSLYYSRLKDLWEEFEALVPIPGFSCETSKDYVAHLQKPKSFQFLMGSNESYGQERSQILLMNPLPNINQEYAMVISDKSQKFVGATAGILGSNPTSTGYKSAIFSRGNDPYSR